MQRARARRGRPADAGHARRGLAGERRRPLQARGRPASGAARPELLRRGPRASPTTTATTASSRSSRARIRGATTRTRGGRRTSTSRCSAARSRSGWSRRCTSPAIRCSTFDPIFHSVRDPKARELLISAFDLSTTDAGVGARLSLGHRARPRRERHDAVRGARRRARRRRRPSARSTRSGCAAGTTTSSCRRTTRRRSCCAASCWTATASRSPTGWSRSGEPASAALGPLRHASGRRPSRSSSRSRPRRPARRRTSRSTSSRAACSSTSGRGCTSRTSRRERGRPGAGRAGRGRPCAARRGVGEDGGLRFDIHLQGARETVFFAT